ncbi:hypothetical protein D3C87_324960 [compost metagenome]
MLASEIKTASDLRAFVEDRGNSHFFDRKTMRFFGDTMKNYGVCKVTIRVNYDAAGDYVDGGVDTEVWELYRKRPVKHGLKDSKYFRTDNFEQTWPRD